MYWLLENAKAYTDLIVFLGVIGGGIGWIWRMLATSKKQVQDLLTSLMEIKEQLSTNGGSSVFDMVKSTAKKTDTIAEGLARLQSWQWAFAETIPQPMWESDAEGNCIRINSAMAKLTGRSVEQMAGNGWENIIDAADRERVYREWMDAVTRRRPFESTYKVHHTPDGKTYQVTAVAMPAKASEGKVVGHIGRYDTVTPL